MSMSAADAEGKRVLTGMKVRSEAFKKQGMAGWGRDGFTLLELMISITMLGIIVLITAGAMRLGFRAVDTGEKKMERLERMRASLNIIDSQIQSEIPLTYNDDGARKYAFKGTRESLRFPTNYSLWSGQMGYVMVTYTVVSQDNGKQALYASENIVGTEGKREAKLFEAADRIAFGYFYKDPTEEEGRWIEEWTDETNIPEKVKLHLIQGSQELSLVIPMRARGSLVQTPPSSTSSTSIKRGPG
jgi:general secretion pathway protein J